MAKTALQKFDSVIERCNDLIAFADSVTETATKNEILRMVIVLAVAGFDSYFREKFSDMLVPYIKQKKPTKALLEMLQSAGFGVEAAIEMLQMDRPHRRIHKLVDDHLERYTTQRTDVIDELFQCYGLKNFCENARNKTGRVYLLKRVGKLIARRHEIVHAADVNGYGKAQSVDPARVKDQVLDVALFVKAADEIASNVLRKPAAKKAVKKTATKKVA
jgi:hypothetical protein